jgi:hypothetical protein
MSSEATARFTLHQRSGYGGILFALLLAVVVEGVAVHLMLAPHHAILAAVSFVFGVSSVLWLIGDYQAIRRRPSELQGEELHLRLGRRKELRVLRADVRALEALPATGEPRGSRDYARFTAVGAPEQLLRLARPTRLVEMYRPPRDVICVGVTLDDEPAFRAALGL